MINAHFFYGLVRFMEVFCQKYKGDDHYIFVELAEENANEILLPWTFRKQRLYAFLPKVVVLKLSFYNNQVPPTPSTNGLKLLPSYSQA